MILGKDAERSLPPRAAIRHLFLEPEPSYTMSGAARLLGMSTKELRRWVDAGEIEPVETKGGLVLPWEEVVFFGMDSWSQAVVEEALGAEVADAIPELVRLTELSVRLPRMEVVALERVAARDGRTVDAVLAAELLGFVSAEAAWLSAEIPGFAEALR
ncbi:MAG TPA: MerR family transcriptional regulator, partial [Thermoanaerobaculia bacterium]